MLATETIAEGVVKALTDEIVDGRLQPGDRLVVETVADQLGVSQIPVREALRQLAMTGLVELKPRRGAFVRNPGTGDPAQLATLFEVRLQLEPWVARVAARRHTAAQLAAIVEAVERGAVAVEHGDLADTSRAHFDLLQAVVHATGNDYAVQALTPLHHATILALRVTAPVTLPDGWRSHVETVEAIARRDGATAAALTRTHLRAVAESLLALSR